MRINNRERIMLMLMVLIALGWFTFDYIIEEQWLSLEEIRSENKMKRSELSELEKLIADENYLDDEIEKNYAMIHEVAKDYFNTTPQEELILLLNDFLLMPFITDNEIAFAEPEWIEVEDIAFVKNSVRITTFGQYESLINMLKTIWSFSKRIEVSELTVTTDGFDEVNGEVTLDFYTFAVDSGIVDNLYKWYIDELFQKGNPFSEPIDNGIIVRYLYVPDENIFNYSKYYEFTDIDGHWNQEEIEMFLDKGYLYLNPYLAFEPDEEISRGEFIVLLDSYYQWPTIYDDQYDLTDFRDYQDLGSLESSFAKAIHKGYLSGVVEGYDDETLRPREPITYGEVEILMRKIKGDETFSWSTVAESITLSKGITNPDWETIDGHLTRAEAVYLLYYFN